MQAEEEFLAGQRGSRTTDINRWCKEKGSVVVGGQRVRIQRQRLRHRGGEEVRLKSYARFHQDDERMRAVYQRMLAGVSCRNYRKTLEELTDAVGVSRSVVSRHIIEATEADIKALCERDLSELDVSVLVIDGMPLDGQMTIVALGVESSGKKHVLGFREGATENAEVCKGLLEDLANRGLKMDRPTLVIMDGSKALRKAVDDFYGVNAVVHRCHFHKSENLRKHLTKPYQAEYARKLEVIYAMRTFDDAHKALKALIRVGQSLRTRRFTYSRITVSSSWI
jgi:transposase-like protein